MPSWLITVDESEILRVTRLLREGGVPFDPGRSMVVLSDLGSYATSAMAPDNIRRINESLGKIQLKAWGELELADRYLVLEAIATLRFDDDSLAVDDEGKVATLAELPASVFQGGVTPV